MFAITLMFQMTMHVTVCATLRIVGIRISNTSRIMLHGSITSTIKVVSSLAVVRRKSSTVLRTCRRTVLKAIATRKTLTGRTIFHRIVITVFAKGKPCLMAATSRSLSISVFVLVFREISTSSSTRLDLTEFLADSFAFS